MVERLFDLSKSNSATACVYFYFREEDHIELKLESIYASFLAQLLQQRESGVSLLPQLIKQYDKLKPHECLPSSCEVLELLQSEAQSFGRIFLVVDALDACTSVSDSNIQANLIAEMRRFCKHWNILITTRLGTALDSREKSDRAIKVEAKDEDINRYVKYCIEQSDELTQRIRKESASSSVSEDTICSVVVRKSQRMWVYSSIWSCFSK